ncbi:MAG: hypothetical protein ACK5NY_06530 [Burkholderiaceae bacterium]
MIFSKNMGGFPSDAIYAIEAAQKEQQVKINQFLTGFLGEDVSKIEHIDFDNDTSKFFNLKAPDYIIEKFRAKDYLQD